jgi:hypothetical protein
MVGDVKNEMKAGRGLDVRVLIKYSDFFLSPFSKRGMSRPI